MKGLNRTVLLFAAFSIWTGAPAAGADGPSAKPLGLSIAAGMATGGTIDTPDLARREVDHDGGFMLRVAWDADAAEKMTLGVYLARFDLEASELDYTAENVEIGVAFKGKFTSDKVVFRPGLSLGYRSIDIETFDDLQGMGLNASAEVGFKMEESNLTPFLEIGFLTQPAGGNDATDMTYGPTVYFLGGLRF